MDQLRVGFEAESSSRTRSSRPRFVATVIAVLAIAASCSSAGANKTAPAPSTTRPPQPPNKTLAAVVAPSRAGPYKVGHETITVVSSDGTTRRTVDVWYPADPSATGAHTRYSERTIPGLFVNSNLAFEGVPVSKDKPFPLVVYSHGSGALRFIATFFTETLASHGFVVVSADHTGDTALDLLKGHLPPPEPQIIASRVADVRLTVNSVLVRSATRGDPLYGSIDPKRIGITGHSYGGLTAFAAVGGVAPVAGDVAIPRDPRFKAIVTMDATPGLLTPDDVAYVRVPVLSILAALSPSDDSLWYYAHADPFVEVHLTRAAHDEFTDVCAWQKLIPNFRQAPSAVVSYINYNANMSCNPPYMTPDRVHTLTNWYAIAFLERYLAGDNRYARYLSQYPPGPHTDVQVARPTRSTTPTT